MELSRNYGNGITITVQANKFTDLIQQLATADELFMDIRCGANIDGKNEISDKVRFQHRKHDGNDYYEQVCMEGKLKWYKRKLGVHKDSPVGSMFVHTSPSDDPKVVNGFAGWGKYQSNGGGCGYQQSQQQPQYAQQQPQHQMAPQGSYQVPAGSYQPQTSQASYDDIPF